MRHRRHRKAQRENLRSFLPEAAKISLVFRSRVDIDNVDFWVFAEPEIIRFAERFQRVLCPDVCEMEGDQGFSGICRRDDVDSGLIRENARRFRKRELVEVEHVDMSTAWRATGRNRK